jgi:hypothetical protein
MKSQLLILTYEIDIEPGASFAVPVGLTDSLTPGRWRITIQPLEPASLSFGHVQGHGAFLNAYAPEDEGWYDDCPPG